MDNLFSYDNIIYRILSKFSELLFLGILWFVFSIPALTFGASTTSLYYTTNKVLLKKRGKIWECFWYSFKSNFKQSTLAWLLVFASYALTFINFYILRMLTSNTGNTYYDYIILAIILLIITTWANYIFFYIARFGNSFLTILKNAFIIAFSNLMRSLLLTLLLIVTLIICYLYFPLIFVTLPAYVCLATKILECVFCKYIPLDEHKIEDETSETEK